MNIRRILKLVFSIWIVLWVFFLAREDKDGQYGALVHGYTHGYEDKVRSLLGSDLYDLLSFAAREIPDGSTYELAGFDKFSIDEVRARYYLWPLKSAASGADFRIIRGEKDVFVPGYRLHATCGSKGRLTRREGGNT